MPLYEYFCKECGKRFDKMMRFGDVGKPVECPYCSSLETSKQITTFASLGASSGGTQVQSSSNCSGGSGRFR
jgi:putative FmdB family regulatory protein